LWVKLQTPSTGDSASRPLDKDEEMEVRMRDEWGSEGVGSQGCRCRRGRK